MLSVLVILLYSLGATLVTGFSYILGAGVIIKNFPAVVSNFSAFLASFFH